MGLKSQIVLIRKANKMLRNEAGELLKERDNYRTAYNDLLRKSLTKYMAPDVTTSGGLRMRPVAKTPAS